MNVQIVKDTAHINGIDKWRGTTIYFEVDYCAQNC